MYVKVGVKIARGQQMRGMGDSILGVFLLSYELNSCTYTEGKRPTGTKYCKLDILCKLDGYVV